MDPPEDGNAFAAVVEATDAAVDGQLEGDVHVDDGRHHAEIDSGDGCEPGAAAGPAASADVGLDASPATGSIASAAVDATSTASADAASVFVCAAASDQRSTTPAASEPAAFVDELLCSDRPSAASRQLLPEPAAKQLHDGTIELQLIPNASREINSSKGDKRARC